MYGKTNRKQNKKSHSPPLVLYIDSSILSGCKDGIANKFHFESQHWSVGSGCLEGSVGGYVCTELTEEKVQPSVSNVGHEPKTKKWWPDSFAFANGFRAFNSFNSIF